MYFYFRYFLWLLSGPGLAPSALLYFYTQQSILKPANLIMPRGPRQNREKCVTILSGGGDLVDKIDMRRFLKELEGFEVGLIHEVSICHS